ncbi:MAG TPA: carbamoyl-phosphate synthase domain-containing protein, partial [Chloroflexota bacterium]|nr:carbamoyl-phosphate synthase domain-containing protein [Chloroflexota bacterium]
MCALAVETVRETEQVAHRSVDRRATLMVADGRCFEGRGVGPSGIVGGELVLTTAMTGYQEALTDPSYRGQILLFTYPLIGNYGVMGAVAQSTAIQPVAVIAATLSPSWSGRSSLWSYVAERDVPAIHDIDTRGLARWIRDNGDCAAAIALHDGEPDLDTLRERIDGCSYDTDDLIAGVTVAQPEIHGHGSRTVALLDCGNKRSVVDELIERETQVIVLPASTPADEIARLS